MKLSAQEEYGLRCLLYIATRGENASLSIPEISRAEGLSIPNVAKLMRILRIGGFVKSVRGQAGGYALAKPPSQMILSNVLETLGGRLFSPSFCERHSGLSPVCNHSSDCSLRSVWAKLQNVIEEVLRKTTLQDLLRGESEMDHLLKTCVQIETQRPDLGIQ